VCVLGCDAVADTMQWTAVELRGSAPQSRLDFASVTLHLRLPPTSSQESSHVLYSEATGGDDLAVSKTTDVQCSGSYLTLYCCFAL